uniref:Uncharacterized protein n=1 Tax=Plectus sambesii TaxID=2011161 RepID=A0A914UPY5_9BILA
QDTPLSPDPSPDEIAGGSSAASHQKSRPRPPSSPSQLAPDTSIEDMAALIDQYVTEQRTNWAELNDVDELWTFADEFSAQRGGIPDNLLKPALLLVLERHLSNTQADWMHRHLTDLVRAWKRETAKEKSDPRPTAVQMAAPSYSPPPEARKRGVNADRKRKLAGLMGVGALLTNARERFGNEEGELQDEDAWVSNQTLDDFGTELSWESWSALSGEKPPPDAVPSFRLVRRPFPPTGKKPWRPPPPAANSAGASKKPPSTPPIEENRKKTTVKDKKANIPAGDEEIAQAPELEEGEMTSSAGSSDGSGSSSS